MPRYPRLFFHGAIYHVYCRVARGEFVFDDQLEAMEFVNRFESASGHTFDHLASRLRSECLIRGRIELSVLSVSRHGFRACDITELLRKGCNSFTRWLNRGLQQEHCDPDSAAGSTASTR